ncbi:MAG: hypothetical protein AB1898_23870 [Acidobacteriota bacterium]
MDQDKKKRIGCGRRVADLAVEVLIGFAIVGLIFYHAEHAPPGHRPDFRWIALAGTTAVTFGYPIKWNRKYWRRKLFWLTMAALLTVHLAAYIAVLLRVEHFGYLWFAIITPFEWTVISPALEMAGRDARPKWLFNSSRE